MFSGILKISGKEIKVSEVEAIDKGVDTYFKGKAETEVPAGKDGVLELENKEHGKLVIKNSVIQKGGTAFEGYGQE